MKNIQFIILIISSIAAISCSKDLGNYDYQPADEIIISGIHDNPQVSMRIFPIEYGESLHIHPTIEIIGNKINKDNLHYFWISDNDTLATTLNLDLPLLKSYASYPSKFVVYSPETGLTKEFHFYINVENSFSKGYYFLNEDPNGNTMLFAKSSVKPTLPTSAIVIENDTIFGKKPNKITLYNAQRILFSQAEGSNSIYSILPTLMKLDVKYNDAARMDKTMVREITNFDIGAPINLSGTQNGIAVNQKKLITATGGALGLPIKFTGDLDYEIMPGHLFNIGAFSGNQVAFYDSKNKKVRVFSQGQGLNNYSAGKTFDAMDVSSNNGHAFVWGSATKDYTGYIYLTKYQNELYMNRIVQTSINIAPQKIVTNKNRTSLPELDKMVTPLIYASQDFVYLAMGRNVYRFTIDGYDPLLIYTLPQDGSGDISSIGFDKNTTSTKPTLMITTYNPSSAKYYKGSYYLMDLATNTLKSSALNVMHKAVDCLYNL